LLSMNDDLITVTAAGRVLVRHVCMVFDVYLRKQNTNRFSKVI